MNKNPRKLKNPLLTGLAALVPTIITLFIIVFAFNLLNHNIAQPLGKLIIIIAGLISGRDIKDILEQSWVTTFIGFPLAIIFTVFLGYLAATFLGRFLLRLLERSVLTQFPLIRSIYPYAKEFSNLFLSDQHKMIFKRVVAIPYPRPGLYSIGFITSEGLKDFDNAFGKKSVTVFLPTSPTPFTGWTVFAPREEVITLNLSVDEAIRLLVTGGVLIPPHQMTDLNHSKDIPQPPKNESTTS